MVVTSPNSSKHGDLLYNMTKSNISVVTSQKSGKAKPGGKSETRQLIVTDQQGFYLSGEMKFHVLFRLFPDKSNKSPG